MIGGIIPAQGQEVADEADYSIWLDQQFERRRDEQAQADDYIANREATLFDFFNDYQDPNADQYELQKQAAILKPTDAEWAAYHSRQIAKTEAF